MPVPPFTSVALEGDPGEALRAVPASPGVGQIVGPEGRSLLIGRPADLRRWAGRQLGLGVRPARKGARPPLDLRPIAIAVRHRATTSAFQQRLVYERLMALHVPRSQRRDLKPPAWVRVDLGERFPRVRVGGRGDDPDVQFGPFRDRGAAARAVEALHRRFPLRPCDYTFEPDPELPLGVGCVFAQVRTCSAPCLQRIGEHDYRSLARDAIAVLARSDGRSTDTGLPAWIAPRRARAVVVERGSEGLEVYPVRAGAVTAVIEECSQVVAGGAALATDRLRWPDPDPPRDDSDWLSAWLHTPRRTGEYVVVDDSWDEDALREKLQSAMDRVAATPK